MKKLNLFFLFLFLAVTAGLVVYQFYLPTWKIALSDQELDVQIAQTPAHIYRGLGGRDSLEPYDGMLFLMGLHKKHGFVMRDMRFSLDIVWLDDGEVVDFVQNVSPQPGVSEEDLVAYYPRLPANIVLELPSGWIAAHGLEIGDRMLVLEE